MTVVGLWVPTEARSLSESDHRCVDTKLVMDYIANTCGAYSALPGCPGCGAPLMSAYEESGEKGLTMTHTCSAGCGFSRRAEPVRRAGAPTRFVLRG